MRIYIAGKYGEHTLPSEVRLANTMKAIRAGRELLLKGHYPFVPHLSHFMHEGWGVDLGAKWYEIDLEWLLQCEAILMLDGWEDSKGAVGERDFALQNGIPVYYSLEEL